MGHSSRPENLMLCLAGLGAVLRDLGHIGDLDRALVAVHRQLFG
jgi:hypothetical protein